MDLEKRVIELEKLVEQQKLFIDQLLTEKQLNMLNQKEQGDCPAGGWHEYPSYWHGTAPPLCKKCGHPAPFTTLLSSMD